jgi:hypothetical protein
MAGDDNSASGFLPVTDCTNAIVCAIRRSRSLIHFMAHLGLIDSSKGCFRNQASQVTAVPISTEVTKG